jgi:hypothetical protein
MIEFDDHAMYAAGTMELFYSEAPDAMRSTASALQLLTVALGKCAVHSPHIEWGVLRAVVTCMCASDPRL